MNIVRYLKVAFGMVLLVWLCTSEAGGASTTSAVRASEATMPFAPTASGDGGWVQGLHLPGVQGHVYAAVADGGGNLYVGGDFGIAGDVDADSIARWDGTRWHALGSGVQVGGVSALAVGKNGELYAGGWFTSVGGIAANHIAKWDGTQWAALGSGTNAVSKLMPAVMALAVDASGALYAGGSFDIVGGVAADHIAKWSGSSWSAVGGGVDDNVYTLFAAGNTLYVGGGFDTAGGLDAPGVARWDGASWSAVTPGLEGVVRSLDVDGNLIAVGGNFSFDYLPPGETYTETYGSLIRWDGVRWTGFPGFVYPGGKFLALEIKGTTLYAGGDFTLGFERQCCLLQWQADDSWSAVGDNVYAAVNALTTGKDGWLYAGGEFETTSYSANDTDVVDLYGVGAWDGSAWHGLGGGAGFADAVEAVVAAGTQVYAGGTFRVPNSTSTGVARWNSGAWAALGDGVDPWVNAVVGDASGTLYAGGFFNSNHIFWWNGASWQVLGGGVDNEVNALALDSKGNLYVAGRFTQAGSVSANRIAKWDGSSWSALGDGLSYTVNALAVDANGNVYAGGKFTSAGGQPANRIAKWDGSSWSALGDGFSGSQDEVYALALDAQGRLYAAGRLYIAKDGYWYAARLARWDGSAWSVVVDDSASVGIYSMAFDSRDRLYVGGGFSQIGGASARNIARWDGSTWSALGSGVDDSVIALAFDTNGDLWVGGNFAHAGDKVSQHIAQYLLRDIAALTKTTSPTRGAPGQVIEYTLDVFWDAEDGRATTAWVQDPLPAAATYVAGSATASSGDAPRIVNDALRWDGTLNDGQHVTLRYRVRIEDCATIVMRSTWPTLSNTATGNVGGIAVSAPYTLTVARPDIAITGVEVTQGIQNLNNDVTLIKDRDTLVRTYVQVIPPQGAPVCNIPVGGTLTGGASPVAPLNADFVARSEPRDNRPSTAERTTRTSSLNFAPPDAWFASAGQKTLNVELQLPGSFSDANPANNKGTVTVTLETQAPLDLLLYKVRWRKDYFGQWYEGLPSAGGRIYMYMKAMYPFPNVNTQFRNTTYPDPTRFDVWTDVYFRVAHGLGVQMVWDRMFGTAPPNAIAYGYLGAPTRADSPDGGLTYPVGRSAAGGTHILDGVYVATHEAGHIFGMQHVDGLPDRACDEPLTWLGWPGGWRPFVETAYPHERGRISSTTEPHQPTTYYGFNAAATNGIRAPSNYDIMTYCGNRWISDYTWDKVRAWATSRSALAVTATSGEQLLVSGIISATEGEPLVTLESLYRLSGVPAQPLPDPGDYTLNLRQGETLLASYPFTVTAGAFISYTDPGFTFFDMVIPYSAGTTDIEVAYGAETMASRAVSAHPPTVTLTLPSAATPLTGTVPLTITASDPDGDELTFTLLSSRDDGATWMALTPNFTETVYALNTADLPGGVQRLRLFASDGVNTVDATTAAFDVAHKPPQAAIVSLEDGAQYPAGENLLLRGVAWDEGGTLLAGSVLHWTDSVSGTLGTGEKLYVPDLTVGWHTITLRAEDSNGRSGQAQIRIFIGTQVFLPVVLRQ